MDAESWNRLFAGQEWLFPNEPVELIVDLVSTIEPGTALELGAGEGRHAIWLAERGWDVTAVDFSGVALARARRRALARGVQLDCVEADALDLFPTRGHFDLVLIAYMHPDPGKRGAIFAAAAGAVAPGGHLLAVGVDIADRQAAFRHPRPARGEEGNDWRFTTGLLSGAFPGLELERNELVSRSDEAEDGTEHRLDALAWGYKPPTAR